MKKSRAEPRSIKVGGNKEELFRDRLIRLGISQIDFASMVGSGISTVQHWAQEKHKVPPLILDILDMIEGVGVAAGVRGARKYFEWKVKKNDKRPRKNIPRINSESNGDGGRCS